MKDRNSDKPARWEEEVWDSQPLMERSNIKRDTYLNCWCPGCGEGLNEDGKAVFRIVNQRGEEGISRVSPYLNVLDRESTIQVDDDEELANVYCPHCNISLIEPNQICKQDQCRMVKIHISVQDSIKLSVIFCVRRSCRWYTMSEEDNERLILRDSHEW
ncbi:MAG: hypothetical protein ACR2PB_05575 [Desulfocapsaceae bacterium]